MAKSNSFRLKELIPLIVIVSVILAVGITLISTKLTPEQTISKYNPMSEQSIKNDLRVLKTPTPGDNTFAYAINQAAAKGVQVAQNDTAVKQILAGQKGRALTIAGVQPTLLQDKSGKVSYSPVGQVIITSNWQYVDGKFYSNPANFNEISNKTGESHQHIWNVFVDLSKGGVTGISEEPERVMNENLQPNFIFSGMNMFMPDTVKVRPGSVLTWFNNSNLPHNVVGIYYKNTTGSSSIPVSVDSGIIQPNESWRYNFNGNGIFDYRCTIHSADGMKGTIVVS
ncbi:MAG: plastocyanin/azurin family copper-binding protein [Nitrososphaeraceae archaeon]